MAGVPTPLYKLTDPVGVLPGCGAKRTEALARLNIYTVGDLIRHYPRGYQNRGDVHLLSDGAWDQNAAYALTVGTQPTSVRLRGGKTVTKFRAFDDGGTCTVVFFNQPYVKDAIRCGALLRFWGKLVKGRSGAELYPSAFEPITEYKPLRNFFPLYPLSAGLTQKFISGLIAVALDGILWDAYPEVLPRGAAQTFGVCGEREAYRCIHFPDSFADIDRGRTRFMAEELFLFACSVSRNKSSRHPGTAPVMKMENSRFDGFLPRLSFKLTPAQSRVISEIRRDMLSPEGVPMARLVSGDVGSGKTVCAAAAAYMTLKNGWQCALMAPTEILAAQHFRELSPLFASLGLRAELLTGSTPAAEKRRIYSLMQGGEPCLFIGTHALISDGVGFSRLGLVVTDEQHRFGVLQRSSLAAKCAVNSGVSPHVLVMSATPIPRTLALILCGDLDISVIDTLPPGRKQIKTLVVGEEHRERMYRFISEQVHAGRQVYIVCPAVGTKEEREEEGADFLDFGYRSPSDGAPADAASGDGRGAESGAYVGKQLDFLPSDMPLPSSAPPPPMKSAVEYAEQLGKDIFPDLRIALVHGRMSGAEKDKVMRDFSAGKTDILVSTTVIEVGVNVPNASVMVVENAERFGLSQLHQLRGRVGRGEYESYCILVSGARGENAARRLDVMKKNSSGFEIAKYDLELRGPGDFMPSQGSARQHGEFKFRLAGLCRDTGLLQLAYAQAKETLDADPELLAPENAGLHAALDKIFERGASALN